MTTLAKTSLRLLLTVLLANMLASCAAPDFSSSSTLVRMEDMRSRAMLEDLHSAGVFFESAGFQALSTRLLKQLYPARHSRFRVALARLPEDNAFALPTGTIVVHLGLLALLENEDQLAFVLAHEVAHIDARHGYVSAHHRHRSRIKAQLADILAFGSGASYGHYAARLRSASRQHELAADAEAAKVVQQAGFKLAEAAAFFELLQSHLDVDSQWLEGSTHPAHSERRRLVMSHQETGHSVPQAAGYPVYETCAVAAGASAFMTFRLKILQQSIEDKIAEFAYLDALRRVDVLAQLGADKDQVRCFRGEVFSGMAETGPGGYIHDMNLRYAEGLEDHEILPQVYDSGVEKKYFHAKALHEFMAVLQPGANQARPMLRTAIRLNQPSRSAAYGCALRGAGLASHALGQRTQAGLYLRHYLELRPDAVDRRYIRRLLSDGISLTRLDL